MMAGSESIRDVIAFPKTQRAQDLLTHARRPSTRSSCASCTFGCVRETQHESDWLKDAAKAGVSTSRPTRASSPALAASRASCDLVDIHHAHDRRISWRGLERAEIPRAGGRELGQLRARSQGLSWIQAKGWVVILEQSKHFCGGHSHESRKRWSPWSPRPSTGARTASLSGL